MTSSIPTTSRRTTIAAVLFMLVTGACGSLPGFAPPTDTPLPPTPSATPEPLAAEVNGERITLDEFEREVARFAAGQTSLGIDLAPSPDDRKAVLRAMIEERVVVQAALSEGLTVEEAAIARGVDQARAARGGDPAFSEWLAQSGYIVEEFTLALKRQMLSRALTDRIVEGVPPRGEQVHAAHILMSSQALADEVRLSIASGADFAQAARTYSQDLSTRAGGGDLGWVPRGWLAVPEIEAAAFALAPGEVSPVIAAADGFHIVRTIERESDRPLSAPALEAARRKALRDWIDEKVAGAQVQVLVALP
ncbi:MAG: peptidylprolyl isomerase [Chloroflexi bacterium]|nr:peptidylprolyl isomerase [Chloroflexota bacterium]